jgi:hypothetical protein
MQNMQYLSTKEPECTNKQLFNRVSLWRHLFDDRTQLHIGELGCGIAHDVNKLTSYLAQAEAGGVR